MDTKAIGRRKTIKLNKNSNKDFIDSLLFASWCCGYILPGDLSLWVGINNGSPSNPLRKGVSKLTSILLKITKL